MFELLRPILHSAEAMLFLTIALGVLLGRQKLRGFSFGSAAGTLIVGTLLGALSGAAAPELSPTLKSIAFLFFVFAVGFQSGPQFFASLGRATLPLAVIAIVVAIMGLIAAVVAAWLFGFDKGTAIGLAAGSLTQTAMLGTAYGALEGVGLSASTLQEIEGRAAVTFALTYVIGTVGVVLFCSQIAPRLIGVDLKAAAQQLEAGQIGVTQGAGPQLDFRSLVARVFRVGAAQGLPLKDLNASLGRLAAVERVRRSNQDLPLSDDLCLQRGDLVAVQGYRPAIVAAAGRIGQEVAAEELVSDLLGDGVDVALASRYAGLTLHDAVTRLGEAGHGVFLRRIRRQSQELPVTSMTVLLPGDVLTLAGPPDRLGAVLPSIGTPVNRGHRADVAFLAAGLLCGVLIGLATLTVKGLPITLSAGGGALIAGLLFGWWHAKRPHIGIPQSATQIMWDFGLAAFCALVGLTAGPQALSALQSEGLAMLAAALMVALAPQFAGLLVGRLLGIHPVLLVGALAGAQTQDAAMLAASDVAQSPTPALGFTVPYAIGNILLTMLGPAVVVLVA